MRARTLTISASCLIVGASSFGVLRRTAHSRVDQPAHSAQSNEPRMDSPTDESIARAMVGVFVAREAAELAAPIAGRLIEVSKRIGDRVSAGEVVARIDARAQELDLAVARAQVAEAASEHAVALAQRAASREREERLRALGEDGLSSGADRAQALAERRVAELRADSVEATLLRQRATADRLSRACEEALVRAPFEGVIAIRYADPGAQITPTRPIVRIVRSGPAIVRFALPEARSVGVGATLRVVVHGSGAQLRARVERVAPEVDLALRAFVVEAEVEGATAANLAGAAADVFLIGAES
jgi:RND family efflux transporter MFP subunit